MTRNVEAFKPAEHMSLIGLSEVFDVGERWSEDSVFSHITTLASFCKLIHLARGTPSVSAVEALKDFNLAVANCFTKCTGLDLSVDAWKQDN